MQNEITVSRKELLAVHERANKAAEAAASNAEPSLKEVAHRKAYDAVLNEWIERVWP